MAGALDALDAGDIDAIAGQVGTRCGRSQSAADLIPPTGAVLSSGLSGGKVHETEESQLTMEDFRAAAESRATPDFREISAAELYPRCWRRCATSGNPLKAPD